MKEWRLRRITSDATLELKAPPAPAEGIPLRALVDQFPGVLWTTDRDFIVTSIVGRGLGSLGLGPNQLVGTNLGELFDVPPAIAAHHRALLGEAVSFPLRLGGRSFHARVAPAADRPGPENASHSPNAATTRATTPITSDRSPGNALSRKDPTVVVPGALCSRPRPNGNRSTSWTNAPGPHATKGTTTATV